MKKTMEPNEHKKKSNSKAPKKKTQKKKENLPGIIRDFLHYLEHHNYRGNGYKKNIKRFYYFLETEGIDINTFYKGKTEKLLFEKISAYEKMLSQRMVKEEITKGTVTIYLRATQLFVKFLCCKGVVNRNYSIPMHLRGRGQRANEYVPKESIIQLMGIIYEHSNHVLRDLAIFLIIVDTGCRPIEVCNLSLNDYNKTERTLPFECGKSARRVLEISSEVSDVLNDYLAIRETYSPKTESLFCNSYGDAISSEFIYTLFNGWNHKAFGEPLYPPKAFRHTLITNALEKYKFQRVSEVVGHKEWRSTNYYVYRSPKRLLSHTLDKSPLKGVFSDGH